MADAIRIPKPGKKWHRPEGGGGWDGVGHCEFTVCRLGLRPVQRRPESSVAQEDRCKRCFSDAAS